MTNRPNGTLYIGVTGNLARRVWEHREGVADGFTARYGLRRLVYVEPHDNIRMAIQREKNLKHGRRGRTYPAVSGTKACAGAPVASASVSVRQVPPASTSAGRKRAL